MDISQIIQELIDLLETNNTLTDEERTVIREAIDKLSRPITHEELKAIIELLLSLFNLSTLIVNQ
jgi:hypothetical protein